MHPSWLAWLRSGEQRYGRDSGVAKQQWVHGSLQCAGNERLREAALQPLEDLLDMEL
jgi:hypothetical protein